MTRLTTSTLLALLLVPLVAADCELQPNQIRIVPVRMRDGDGSMASPITNNQVDQWVDVATSTWIWDFVVRDGGLQTFDNTVLNTPPDTEAEDQAYQNAGNWAAALVFTDGVPVYFRARGGGGFSWGPTTNAFVSMPAWTNTAISKPTTNSPNTTLLSHELGHYFGLPHTFGTGDCTKVSLAGSDGDATGQTDYAWDDILDTPADPGGCNSPNTTSLTCNESAQVTVNGNTFSPPWTNLMSYHDCLPESMSGDQIVVLGEVLQDPARSYVRIP